MKIIVQDTPLYKVDMETRESYFEINIDSIQYILFKNEHEVQKLQNKVHRIEAQKITSINLTTIDKE